MNNINNNTHSSASFNSYLRPGYSATDAAKMTQAVQQMLTKIKGLFA